MDKGSVDQFSDTNLLLFDECYVISSCPYDCITELQNGSDFNQMADGL